MTNCMNRIAISIGLLLASGNIIMSDDLKNAPESPKGTDEAPDYDAMIEALANRNQKPEIVPVENGVLPKFSADYDWSEYDRVAKLRGRLFKNEDPRLWEHFLKYMGDDRYALTVGGGDPGEAMNYSVGDICTDAARARVDFARVHMKVRDGERFDQLWLDLGNTNLPKWRKDHSEKSLRELQIEVCETALQKIKLEMDVSQEARMRIERKLRDEIKLLTKMTKPLFYRVPEEFDLFDAKKAERIRDRIARERQE